MARWRGYESCNRTRVLQKLLLDNRYLIAILRRRANPRGVKVYRSNSATFGQNDTQTKGNRLDRGSEDHLTSGQSNEMQRAIHAHCREASKDIRQET
jgi:hypothetical protein